MKFKSIFLTLIFTTNMSSVLNACEEKLAANASQAVLELVCKSGTKWRGKDKWKKAIQQPGAKEETISTSGTHLITNENSKIKVVSQLKDNRYILTPVWPLGNEFNSKDISDIFTKCNYKSLKIRRAFATTVIVDNPNSLKVLMDIECTSTFDLEHFVMEISK